MRLTLPMFLFKLPNGHIFRGKNRLVKPVSKKAVETLKKDLALEERNMFYLRHPYLTKEQSSGHSKHLQKHEKWLAQFKIERNEKFEKHRRLQDELSHLKTKEDWDFSAGSI
uniref:Ribosomal protein 63, mitochondrial n=1 Tax=Riptortus pedestris TaxID=329032 RepID=R4WNN4_RIPPE|nr:conserved hypothetical protein [Riptortus pedestris]